MEGLVLPVQLRLLFSPSSPNELRTALVVLSGLSSKIHHGPNQSVRYGAKLECNEPMADSNMVNVIIWRTFGVFHDLAPAWREMYRTLWFHPTVFLLLQIESIS
ncbi:hypothetical protein AVEN_59375-1 [Araneus ventricosus]|uniref:Uncharacterized protein n=1 Tax=Araneus ventricosus TaxID=182803 RepID=A0A4Y2TCN8_ARAVE|nr:hypothetical protein AVEN_59375-1 [Araneus ventricosus]